MAELIKIGALAKKYKISTRTIRYYEEVGLIKSNRNINSKVRFYNLENISKLEQVLLLRGLDFSINDIVAILNKGEDITRIFDKKLEIIRKNILELSNLKELIETIRKIYMEQGSEKVNLYNLIRDQMYINSKNERRINMEKNQVMIEFGKALIPLADRNQGGKLIDKVKEMRESIEKEIGKKLPLIRIRDNSSMEDFQYRIVIKDKMVFSKEVEKNMINETEEEIVKKLRESILENKLA